MSTEPSEAAPRPSPHLFAAHDRSVGSPESAADEMTGPGEHPEAGGPPAAPAERGAGGSEPTGNERVDEAMSRLTALAQLPVGEQVDAYEDVHRALQDTLATVDDA